MQHVREIISFVSTFSEALLPSTRLILILVPEMDHIQPIVVNGFSTEIIISLKASVILKREMICNKH